MRVVFGDYEFDSGRLALLRHGSTVPLSRKAFQILEILLDRRPDVVTKPELLDRLWPDSFVSDASLHNAVSEIRAALRDAPQSPRFIRTVPRFGYAFHGDARPVQQVGSSAPTLSRARLASEAREWQLSDGPNLVGRERDCSVRIDSATLSRHHARIVVTDGQATIEDLGSKNGTFVNRVRVDRALPLKDRDEIQIGSARVTYRVLAPLPSTLTREA